MISQDFPSPNYSGGMLFGEEMGGREFHWQISIIAAATAAVLNNKSLTRLIGSYI